MVGEKNPHELNIRCVTRRKRKKRCIENTYCTFMGIWYMGIVNYYPKNASRKIVGKLFLCFKKGKTNILTILTSNSYHPLFLRNSSFNMISYSFLFIMPLRYMTQLSSQIMRQYLHSIELRIWSALCSYKDQVRYLLSQFLQMWQDDNFKKA